MKILMILGHPNPQSFNHAIATTAGNTLKQLGHEVIKRDLYAEQFNPLLSKAELLAEEAIPEEIVPHCRELAAADGIIIIHPNWRDQPPAIVKGWVDRVFRVGVAFEYTGEAGQPGTPVGLLQADSALVLTTSDCPILSSPDPLEQLWQKSILESCGVKKVDRKNFSSVLLSTPEERQSWLSEVERITKKTFSPVS